MKTGLSRAVPCDFESNPDSLRHGATMTCAAGTLNLPDLQTETVLPVKIMRCQFRKTSFQIGPIASLAPSTGNRAYRLLIINGDKKGY